MYGVGTTAADVRWDLSIDPNLEPRGQFEFVPAPTASNPDAVVARVHVTVGSQPVFLRCGLAVWRSP